MSPRTEQIGALVLAGTALGGVVAGFTAMAVAPDAVIAFAIIGAIAGAFGGASFIDRFVPPSPALREEIEAAARKAGLKRKRRGARFAGYLEGGPVEIAQSSRGVQVVVKNIVKPLAIVRTPGYFDSRPHGDDVVTGDPAFDPLVHVAGNETTARALLDAETRATIASTLTRCPNLRVSDGELTWLPPAELGTDELALCIVALARLGKRLRSGDRARLAAVIREDPVPAVRFGALQALLADPGSNEELVETTARAACGDADAEVRLEAARHLKDHAVLHAIAVDESIEIDSRLSALDGIAESGRHAAVRSVVEAVLRGNDDELLARAVELVGEFGIRELLASVAGLTRPLGSSLREVQAKTLRALPDPANEPVLLALLDPPALDAVIALGEQGTVAAVEPLRTIFKAWTTSDDMRAATARAIEAIQARLEHADAGQLTIAESEQQGRVSVAKQQAGQVSIKKTD